MRIARLCVFVAALIAASPALAQSLQQAGPVFPGHMPMYSGSGFSQPLVQDGGGSNGCGIAGCGAGANPGELGITSRAGNGDNVAPYASNGNGPLGEHFCMFDAPTTNPTGYHYLCFDPNAQGGGLIDYGAAGGATPIPFSIEVNGVINTFPFSGGGSFPSGTPNTLLGFSNTGVGQSVTTIPSAVTIPGGQIVAGSIPGSALATGAASANIGTLSGDLAGTLPSPTISSGAVTSAKMAAGAAATNLGGGTAKTGLLVGNGTGAATAITPGAGITTALGIATNAAGGILTSLGHSNIVLHVDNVNGADSATCGTTTGTGACATPQQALNNLCANYYPINNVPTIQFTAGQTYTSGLLFSGGATVSGAEPQCIGIGNILIDGQGSTMTSSGNTLYCRYASMGVGIRNLTISSSGAGAIAFRGGGCMLSIETGVTIGSAANGYPQILAYGGGQVATCPTTEARCIGNVVNIAGGGGCFVQATNGGQIQIEGVTINIAGTPTYSVAFSCVAESGSTVSFFQSTITGTNVVGDQFFGTKLGYTDTNGQGSLVTPGYYTTCTNTYLPGSTCGQNYFGARFSDPGLPALTGCGTGAVAQNYEPYSIIILGTGLTTTNGTLISSCRVNMATRTNYTACTATANNGANFTNLQANFVGPTSTVNGYVVVNFLANGSSSAGSSFSVNCFD